MPKESDGTPVDCGGFADSDLAVSAPPASRALALGHEQPAAAALSSWLSRIVRLPLARGKGVHAGCALAPCPPMRPPHPATILPCPPPRRMHHRPFKRA